MSEDANDPQRFRSAQLRALPGESGVYALCDLDGVPIYIGSSIKSKAEGIGPRVRRHLTSARSDVIANRQLDVWEVGYVLGWLCNDADVKVLEALLFHLFDRKSPLINGTVPGLPTRKLKPPEPIKVQILSDSEIALRKQPRYRFPRQVQQFNQLLDYILHTKDESHLRRALNVHLQRVNRFYAEFTATKPQITETPEGSG